MTKSERNGKIDLLRVIGIVFIMVAHAKPPDLIFQIKNFATPLLIICSALTISQIQQHREIILIELLKKRLRKLVLPVWAFLTIFLAGIYLICSVLQRPFPYSKGQIILSYLLQNDGIGYVWIFGVYVFLAFITPFSLSLKNKRIIETKFTSVFLTSIILFQLSLALIQYSLPPTYAEIANKSILCWIGYAIIFQYGLQIENLNKIEYYTITITASIVLLIFTLHQYIITGSILPRISNYKIPPQTPYFAYSIFTVNIITSVAKRVKIPEQIQRKLQWISANSLWIYLWHIPLAIAINDLHQKGTPSPIKFIAYTIILIGFGTLMTIIQKLITTRTRTYVGRFSATR